jgi:DNA-binding PadR family transcriptional regulator
VAGGDLVLALLGEGPRHGYQIKQTHDAWFPDARPLAFGQVYATLGRLQRDGLVEVVDTRSEGAAERTVYALTAAGRARLAAWLAEPAPPGGAGGDEIVRKTVAALRTGAGAAAYLSAQRTAHLRLLRELSTAEPGPDTAARLGREHTVAHLDADLRWLERAAELVEEDRR